MSFWFFSLSHFRYCCGPKLPNSSLLEFPKLIHIILCIQPTSLKVVFSWNFISVLAFFYNYLITTWKKTDANLWELHKYPSSTLKTDRWFLFCFFLALSRLWQYFVLLACTVTWVALCEGLDQIFWESSNKQCVLVFLYSIGFFLILERIQLLNRSTLCSIHLVPSTMQESSAFTCSEGFSFPLVLRSLWGFPSL